MTATALPASDVCIRPVEDEPLAHFLPGTSVLHMSDDVAAALADGEVAPADVIDAARRGRCASVAVPSVVAARASSRSPSGVISRRLHATVDLAHGAGLRCITLADGASPDVDGVADIAQRCDAVIVETGGALLPWVEALVADDDVWVEVLAHLTPDRNDGDASIHDLSSWVMGHLGPELPVHFAGLPDAPVPSSSLRRARSIGLGDGLHYVYTSPLDDRSSGTTLCPGCGERLIERHGTCVTAYRLTATGRCHACGAVVAGCFDRSPSGRAAVLLAPTTG